MVDPSQALPPAEEREELLDALAELVEQVGAEPLIRAPLLLPREDYFPDPWTPDEAGIYRLARRLLRYAGLGDLDVSVELFSEDDPARHDPWVHSERHSGAAAWFAGIHDGVVDFGANVEQLDDPLGLTAALAHETSHAFRFHHGLMVDDLTTEEQLTDLTTVYLGFGLLTTNVALRHRSQVIAGTLGASRYQRTMLGYLSPQTMSFLLACHQLVRDEAAKGVVRELESNQAHYYRKARGWLEAQVPDLRGRLGVPEPSAWPEPWSLEELTAPIHFEGSAHEDRVDAEPRELESHEDARAHPVLRVPEGKARFTQLGVGVFGLIITLFSVEWGLWVAALLVVVTIWAVRAVGRRRTWRCSHCDTKVRPSVSSCPRCSGMFVMDLQDPADRLEIDPWEVLAARERPAGGVGAHRSMPEESTVDVSEIEEPR